MSEATKCEKFQRLIFTKLSGKLSLWQAGRQCQGSDLNSARWWFCSVDTINLSRHLFVQWYRLGAVFRSPSFVIVSGVPFCAFGRNCCDMCVFVCVRATATASKCLWYSFVPFCQQLQHSGGTNSRRRTQDQSERSNAQTVTLQSKSVGWTFSGWGPIRRRMGWVLAANQVRHSTDTAYRDVSPAPGWSWYQPAVPGNSVFDAVAAMTQGLG